MVQYNPYKIDRVFRPCFCNCCKLLVERYTPLKSLQDNDEDGIFYEISIVDSCYNDNRSLWFRIKSAFKVLFGKPVYYNDLILEPEDYEAFVKEMEVLSHV